MSDRFDVHDMKLLNLKHYLGYSFKVDFFFKKNHPKYLKCGLNVKLFNFDNFSKYLGSQTINEDGSITYRKSS